MNAIRAMLAQGRMAAPAVQEDVVAFAWDGITFDVGTLDEENVRYPITITLTKAGVPITQDALCFAYVSEPDSFAMHGEPFLAADNEQSIVRFEADEGQLCLIHYQGAPLSAWLWKNDASFWQPFTIHAMLPDGSMVVSEQIIFPGA